MFENRLEMLTPYAYNADLVQELLMVPLTGMFIHIPLRIILQKCIRTLEILLCAYKNVKASIFRIDQNLNWES